MQKSWPLQKTVGTLIQLLVSWSTKGKSGRHHLLSQLYLGTKAWGYSPYQVVSRIPVIPQNNPDVGSFWARFHPKLTNQTRETSRNSRQNVAFKVRPLRIFVWRYKSHRKSQLKMVPFHPLRIQCFQSRSHLANQDSRSRGVTFLVANEIHQGRVQHTKICQGQFSQRAVLSSLANKWGWLRKEPSCLCFLFKKSRQASSNLRKKSRNEVKRKK